MLFELLSLAFDRPLVGRTNKTLITFLVLYFVLQVTQLSEFINNYSCDYIGQQNIKEYPVDYLGKEAAVVGSKRVSTATSTVPDNALGVQGVDTRYDRSAVGRNLLNVYVNSLVVV